MGGGSRAARATTSKGTTDVKKVEAIIRPEKIEVVKEALAKQGYVGLNVVQVVGRGVQKGIVHEGRGGVAATIDMLPKSKVEIVCKDADAEKVISTIIAAARTGAIGDGKIFVTPVADAVRVRTGERGDAAL
jgi:nitrogen regulatory protein P-II 1